MVVAAARLRKSSASPGIFQASSRPSPPQLSSTDPSIPNNFFCDWGLACTAAAVVLLEVCSWRGGDLMIISSLDGRLVVSAITSMSSASVYVASGAEWA